MFVRCPFGTHPGTSPARKLVDVRSWACRPSRLNLRPTPEFHTGGVSGEQSGPVHPDVVGGARTVPVRSGKNISSSRTRTNGAAFVRQRCARGPSALRLRRSPTSSGCTEQVPSPDSVHPELVGDRRSRSALGPRAQRCRTNAAPFVRVRELEIFLPLRTGTVRAPHGK